MNNLEKPRITTKSLDSIDDSIQKRVSIRTYSSKKLDNETVKKIKDVLKRTTESPFEGNSSFKLLKLDDYSKQNKKKFGTYGFIKNAQYFIGGSIAPSQFDLEHYGYIFERIILQLTVLDLGTCWLGGTFSRSNFAEFLLDDPETSHRKIPAVSPIGYPAEKNSFRDKIIKFVARSHKRKPWDDLFYLDNLQHSLTPNMVLSEYKKALENVRLAPSARNAQPWRIIKESDQDVFHFYIQRKKITTDIKNRTKFPDMPRLDIGIAVCHFDCTIKELELSGEWFINSEKKTEHLPNNLQYTISWKNESLPATS